VGGMEAVLGEGIKGSGDRGIETGHRFTGAAPAIDLAALIGRKPYEMDRGAISGIIGGRCVLITGAGGSIGSELAKVAAAFEPSMLVLMERAENALFEIDRQIARHFPGVPRKAVLHDVVDAEATLRLCEKLRPQVVFHAAAHKHVPLMEDHPAHAVTNNLFGTKSIADAAVAVGAERFVMISSDKAVNPTSVMGATKRLAEMYVRGLGNSAECRVPSAERGSTRLSMVRFGNVLGSAASVLTIWAQQIAEGGPITITDPRMTRYFMTIPEAATLVVQSAALGAEGIEGSRDQGIEGRSGAVGVYVLDMGEPVKIVDLASRFVRAHGMTARIVGNRTTVDAPQDLAHSRTARAREGQTIDVVVTGIRPGEKLHEELAYAAEQLLPTGHPGVRAWAGPGFGADVAAAVTEMVAEMGEVRFSPDPARVVGAIRRHVPEMRASPISPEPAAAMHAG
jgi:FlaA1/EpsC-like NDP-sugar epimerase